MKFCTSYYQNENIRRKVNELRWSMYSFTGAIEYSEGHPDIRIIVEILNLSDSRTPSMDILNNIQQENNQIYYDFYSLDDLIAYADYTQSNHIMYHQPALTWNLVQILLAYNVSDITIGEPLTFSMNDIEKNIRSLGVNVRVRPYIARNSYQMKLQNDNGAHHFWILPQHLYLYENYIDVIDLIDDNIAREEGLVNAYTSTLPYNAYLSTLIQGLNTEVGAQFIDETFVNSRLNCGQYCMKNKNSCHRCDQYIKMYDVINLLKKNSN